MGLRGPHKLNIEERKNEIVISADNCKGNVPGKAELMESYDGNYIFYCHNGCGEFVLNIKAILVE